EFLGRADVNFDILIQIWPELQSIPEKIRDRVGHDAAYAHYVARQKADIASFHRDEALRLPASLDYGQLSGLSSELRQKLEMVRPLTVGQAGRIEGMTPAALLLLAAASKRHGASPNG